MNKSLYTKPMLCFAVKGYPSVAQAKVIFDWAILNGADDFQTFNNDFPYKYFGVDHEGRTMWSRTSSDYIGDIITFAEFAELAGVEAEA